MPPGSRRRRAPESWAIGLLVVGSVAAAALGILAWLPGIGTARVLLTAGLVVALLVGWVTARVVGSELFYTRRAAAADRADQARLYREHEELRAEESREFWTSVQTEHQGELDALAAQMAAQLTAVGSEHAAVSSARDALREQAVAQAGDAAAARNRLLEAEAEVRRLQRDLSLAENDYARLDAELRTRQGELAAARAAVTAQRTEASRLAGRVADLEAELVASHQEVLALRMAFEVESNSLFKRHA